MADDNKKKLPPFKGKKTDKTDTEKTQNPEITDKVEVIFDPTLEGGILDETFRYIIECNPDLFDEAIVEEYLSEILSVAGRLRRKQQVRRYKAKMLIARKRSLRRRASMAKIKGRARRTAISNVKRKLAGGRTSKQMTYAERARVEKLAARRKGAIQRQARRLVIKKRALERSRLSGKRR